MRFNFPDAEAPAKATKVVKRKRLINKNLKLLKLNLNLNIFVIKANNRKKFIIITK